MKTIKTTIHAFEFNTRNPQEKEQWLTLRARLSARGTREMESHGGESHYKPRLDGLEIDLETKHLFDNQWNAAPIPGISDKGLRVFDFAFDYHPNGNEFLKRGHYLDETAEMRELRRNTVKCGYCGHQEPAARGAMFCQQCVDSEYLKESDLHLLRMLPIDAGFNADRAPLSEVEKAHLIPLYREAQIHGSTERDKARIAKAHADIVARAEKITRDAATEKDGFLFFLNRGIQTGNLIFYSHTGRFCWGWREPVGEAILSRLLDVMSEFPFPYDIKTTDGRTLSGSQSNER